MISRILIDTNIFVYAAGRPHPLRAPSRRILDLTGANEAFFTGSEVLQELLHYYLSRRVWDSMQGHFHAVVELMRGRTEPLLLEDVEQAAGMAEKHTTLQARDLLHAAVMQRVGSTHIVTADRAFDEVDGITRLDPARVEEWQSLVTDN